MDPADRLAWISLLRALHRLCYYMEALYWEILVSRNARNPKRLWFSISDLLGKPLRPLETSAFSADDFLKNVGRGGSLVEMIPVNRRIMASSLALAAT